MAKILVVEDTELIRKLVVTLLAFGGHEVTEAADGVEGLQCFRASPPDLVITDIAMPNMGGKEFISELAREYSDSCPPILVLSADEGSDLEQEMLNLGASVVVAKTGLHKELMLSVVGLLR